MAIPISTTSIHISTMNSISTELSKANLFTPTDALACFPFSPKTSTRITLAWPVKDGSQLTKPKTLTNFFTLSRLPSACFNSDNPFIMQTLAAARPFSSETSLPSFLYSSPVMD